MDATEFQDLYEYLDSDKKVYPSWLIGNENKGKRQQFSRKASKYSIRQSDESTNQQHELPVLTMFVNRSKMSNLYRGPSIDATYHVSVHLAKRFRSRRFKYSQPTEPLVYILYCIICMLMFHHACLSFSIKSLRNNLC
jgi:hypothetical protein